MLTKDYDEVKNALDTYLDRIGYHYEYFGNYMDEVQALQKAAKELYFEKAVNEIVWVIQEQGMDVINFAKGDISQLSVIFKDYAQNLEEIAALESKVFKELKIKTDFEKQYQIINEIYNVACEEKEKIRLFTL